MVKKKEMMTNMFGFHPTKYNVDKVLSARKKKIIANEATDKELNLKI